ncbi:Uncharacterised protein [Legionella cherrii]|uniref:Uncharacterized protein n=1 Tax=Legionella cherrii TaxID=28084 RepID=A0ABY6T5P8_9GAMM|nr:Uncharacterised protein [Legionella cherrii]
MVVGSSPVETMKIEGSYLIINFSLYERKNENIGDAA